MTEVSDDELRLLGEQVDEGGADDDVAGGEGVDGGGGDHAVELDGWAGARGQEDLAHLDRGIVRRARRRARRRDPTHSREHVAARRQRRALHARAPRFRLPREACELRRGELRAARLRRPLAPLGPGALCKPRGSRRPPLRRLRGRRRALGDGAH
eukprot:2411717-Prymnesium_polylepis.1